MGEDITRGHIFSVSHCIGRSIVIKRCFGFTISYFIQWQEMHIEKLVTWICT